MYCIDTDEMFCPLCVCSKEGRGGTEGRPGSPTSTVDGTDNQPDPPKGKQLRKVNTCVVYLLESE